MRKSNGVCVWKWAETERNSRIIEGALTLVPFACSVLEHDSPPPFPPLGPWSHCSQRPWPGHDCAFIHTSSRRNTINTSSPSVLAAITTMENNNENNTEIVTENTIGTFLTSLLIWSRSFKIRSSLNAGFSISMSRKDYVIRLTLRIRACARVISLASVLWPRHTSPKRAVAKGLFRAGVRMACSH